MPFLLPLGATALGARHKDLKDIYIAYASPIQKRAVHYYNDRSAHGTIDEDSNFSLDKYVASGKIGWRFLNVIVGNVGLRVVRCFYG